MVENNPCPQVQHATCSGVFTRMQARFYQVLTRGTAAPQPGQAHSEAESGTETETEGEWQLCTNTSQGAQKLHVYACVPAERMLHKICGIMLTPPDQKRNHT